MDLLTLLVIDDVTLISKDGILEYWSALKKSKCETLFYYNELIWPFLTIPAFLFEGQL